MAPLTISNIRWANVNDKTYDSMGMTRRCTAAAINVIKKFSGKRYEMNTNSISELSAAVENIIVTEMGYKPNVSTCTLRRHGLLKLEVKNGKGYAVFTMLAFAVKKANADRSSLDAKIEEKRSKEIATEDLVVTPEEEIADILSELYSFCDY